MKNIDFYKLSADEMIENRKISVIRKTVCENFKLHWHDFFEIEIIIDGSASQILNGKKYDLKRGYVYLLTTTDFHEILMDSPLESYNIMFDESILSEGLVDKIMNIKDNLICLFEGEELDKIIHLAELLRLENQYDEEYINNLLDCMVMLILKHIKIADKKTNKQKNSSKVLMHKASLYMRMHFRDNLSLDDIASYVNLNSSYFCKIFHSEMGTSPKQYLSALRLEYAKKLLSITDLPVIEICFACGYNSLSNFLKAFKQKYGFSPKCIRSRE